MKEASVSDKLLDVLIPLFQQIGYVVCGLALVWACYYLARRQVGESFERAKWASFALIALKCVRSYINFVLSIGDTVNHSINKALSLDIISIFHNYLG